MRSVRPTSILTLLSIAITTMLALCLLSGCSGSRVSENVVLKAINNSNQLSSGFVLQDYLDIQPYEVSELSILSDDRGLDKHTRIIVCSYIVSNDNTSSEVSATLVFDTGSKEPRLISARSVEARTVPLKGIDFDEQHGLQSCEAKFDPTSNSCVVSRVESYNLWFADSSITSSYSYSFVKDGNMSRWKFEKEDASRSTTYKNLEGGFYGKTGKVANFTSFTIKNLDPVKGTFDIDYTYTVTTTSLYSSERRVEEASGTLHAVIDTENGSWLQSNKQEDGLSHFFEAKGTSSRGNGEASLTGTLVMSDSGEDKIEISARIDSEAAFGGQTFYISGPLYRVK